MQRYGILGRKPNRSLDRKRWLRFKDRCVICRAPHSVLFCSPRDCIWHVCGGGGDGLWDYPIFFNLAIECGESYLEQAGRLCLVAMSMVKSISQIEHMARYPGCRFALPWAMSQQALQGAW